MPKKANLAPVHVRDLFDNPNVLQLHINPQETQEPAWYCARDICQVIGCAWTDSERTLKKIPEHHKAQLGHHYGDNGYRNVWCLSAGGVLALHRQMTNDDPINFNAWQCANRAYIVNLSPEKPEQTPSFWERLAEARQNITPSHPHGPGVGA